MKKGELKKQELIETAEALFCHKGYEATSVQDILDILHTSKGSFYHHFESKESLLEAMCLKRAVHLADLSFASLPASGSSVEKMNLLFSGMMPLSGEKLSFLMMLLPVFALPEGRSVKNAYCEALSGTFAEKITETLESGIEAAELYCRHPRHVASVCIDLINHLWCKLCDIILMYEKSGKQADISELLTVLDVHRTAVEKMISAPYGSLVLLDLNDLKLLTGQIHLHWNR